VTLLGPSGCGQDHALRAIAGSRSRIRGGRTRQGAISRAFRRTGPMSVSYSGYALFPHLTVAGNVGLWAESARARQVGDRRGGRARAVAGQAEHLAKRRISALSGGQQQLSRWHAPSRSSPTCAVSTSALRVDRKLREEMQVELRACCKNVGATASLSRTIRTRR